MLFRCLFFWRNLLCKETPQMFTLNEMSWIRIAHNWFDVPVLILPGLRLWQIFLQLLGLWWWHLSIVNTAPAQLQLQLQYSQQHQVNTPSVQLQLQYSQQHYANSSVNVCSILLDLIHKRYSKANNILQTFVIAVPAIFLDNKTTLEFQPIWYKSWQMFAPSAEKFNQAMSTWFGWILAQSSKVWLFPKANSFKTNPLAVCRP